MQRNLLKQFGNDAEELGVRFLQEAGYVIVERNYYARKLGEIDIIAQHLGSGVEFLPKLEESLIRNSTC